MAQIADARISIRISHAQKNAFQEEARKEGRSLSNWAIQTLIAKVHPSGTNRPDHR